MYLSRFARVRLGHFPTALERLDNLTRHLGGPEIWIKRDDCTGLATGGNKTRKLEFLVGDALAQGADTLVTQGATQSNHVRQTAAAACKTGLRCHALLEQRVTNMGDAYSTSGNVLMDDIMGCEYEERPEGLDMNAEGEALAEKLRTQGRKPYFIPGGGSNTIGALGYVACANEMVQQFDDERLTVDAIVHATGSTGTQAGLLAGLHAMNVDIPVMGVSVRAPEDKQRANVHRLAVATADLLGARGDLPQSRVAVDDTEVGGGYGQPTDAMVDAIALLARQEGILLDPVYSGKGFAGLLSMIRRGVLTKGQRVVFIHTGGSSALFAYGHLFSRQTAPTRAI
ncbi:D-cysteine desulfhydrase [Oceaniglobus indicus]|uniref:D-cysteine desulfhydrase n=1 Tax=Oceaniglobus indicus TaxID=2047749 RepID=UPI000C1A3B9C|nr:D-cysteine desulfhydrase [Oceaniglobus indicus]